METEHWSVTELTSRIKGVLEPAFKQIWVQGEISNYRPASSGHVYFSLKDEVSSVSAAIFGWGRNRRTGFELKDGLKVLCRGRVSVYAPRGSYQLVVDVLEPLGAGAMQYAFEQLKAKLAAEGLFSPERKRKLPSFPGRVAIVTSPGGAVIQDILNVLGRRAPGIRVTIIPALVQGATAAAEIQEGLRLAQVHSLGDLVILARGGGSAEDLWCFNDESLVRAVAGSELPVISAVGHETDFTLTDFVADVRAPTPSAAAEILSQGWVDARSRVSESRDRIQMAMSREIRIRRDRLETLRGRLVSPKDRLREQAQRCDDWTARLNRAMELQFERRRSALQKMMVQLDALSPLRVLERGWALVLDADRDGRVIRRASDVITHSRMRIRFHDGEKTVQALD